MADWTVQTESPAHLHPDMQPHTHQWYQRRNTYTCLRYKKAAKCAAVHWGMCIFTCQCFMENWPSVCVCLNRPLLSFIFSFPISCSPFYIFSLFPPLHSPLCSSSILFYLISFPVITSKPVSLVWSLWWWSLHHVADRFDGLHILRSAPDDSGRVISPA